MRKVFLTLLLSLPAMLVALGQRPLLEEGKKWNYFMDTWPPNSYFYSNFIAGDTVVDGKSCKKLFRQIEGEAAELEAVLYEDGGKVYRVGNDASLELVYDFTLEVGDEFTQRGYVSDFTFAVTDVRTVSTAGGDYKVILLEYTGADRNGHVNWAEGIGGEKALCFNGLDLELEGAYDRFVSCEKEDGTIFVADDFYAPDEAVEKELVRQANGFAFRLFGQTRGDDSQVLSPLSVTYALSLLNNGAAGQTRQEISKALGFGDTSLEAVNAFCHKVMTTSDALDPQTRLQLANSVWVNQPFSLTPRFRAKAEGSYNAYTESRDFADGLTRGVINQWGSDHTNGMIPEVLNEQEFNPMVVSYLLNAVWFKGTWTLKFDPAETQEEAFGSTGMTVPMMHQHVDLYYTEDATCQALRLPYGNKSYSMTVFLPREGKTIGDVLSLLESGQWTDRYGSMPINEVDVKLPRMDVKTGVLLNDAMKALGMKLAFDEDYAEFPRFCNEDTYLGLLKQDSRLKLDEEGTEAASITVGVVVPMDGTPLPTYTFHANRPFLYVISEKSTGLIYFIGQMADGSTPAEGYDAVTLTQAGIGTYCSSHDLDFSGTEGLKAYIASGYDQATGTVLLTRAEQVPAGTGIVVMGSEGTRQVPWTETGYTYANMLCGVLESTEVPTEDGGYRNYILADGADGVLFYQSSGSGSLPAHRAYLRVPVGDKPLPLALPYSVGDSTTGVGDALRPSAGGSIYSLSGQRVSSPRKGLYVRDGKKVLIP